jgi:hypothetical protein
MDKNKLPQEFIEFARKNIDKYTSDQLRVLLYQRHNLMISLTGVRSLLKDAGIVKTKKVKPCYYKTN